MAGHLCSCGPIYSAEPPLFGLLCLGKGVSPSLSATVIPPIVLSRLLSKGSVEDSSQGGLPCWVESLCSLFSLSLLPTVPAHGSYGGGGLSKSWVPPPPRLGIDYLILLFEHAYYCPHAVFAMYATSILTYSLTSSWGLLVLRLLLRAALLFLLPHSVELLPQGSTS